MNNSVWLSRIVYVSMALIFVGVVMQLGDSPVGLYVMAGGALSFFVIRLLLKWQSPKENRRINTVMVYSAMLFLVSVIAIYMGKRYWMLPIVLASMLELYISFRIEKTGV